MAGWGGLDWRGLAENARAWLAWLCWVVWPVAGSRGWARTGLARLGPGTVCPWGCPGKWAAKGARGRDLGRRGAALGLLGEWPRFASGPLLGLPRPGGKVAVPVREFGPIRCGNVPKYLEPGPPSELNGKGPVPGAWVHASGWAEPGDSGLGAGGELDCREAVPGEKSQSLATRGERKTGRCLFIFRKSSTLRPTPSLPGRALYPASRGRWSRG